jgi:thioredoxin-like negative regulator of GroEL
VNVKVAKVDGDAERAIKSRFGITHFPSFFSN